MHNLDGINIHHLFEVSMPLQMLAQMSLWLCPLWVTLYQRVQWLLSRRSRVSP